MPNSNFLSVSVKITHGRHKIRVWLPLIAFFVLRDAIISFDGWLSLIPGNFGAKARKGSDALQAMFYALTQSEIDVNVDVAKDDSEFKVRVNTL